MTLNVRQAGILNSIVEEYINSAEPVSSKLLEKKYGFEICPATIRIEMQKLTDEGLISQPHTSAGRVPTDKGYRYFVDELLEKDIIENEGEEYFVHPSRTAKGGEERTFFDPSSPSVKETVTENLFKEERIEDTVKLLQSLTKNLAALSSNLALGYLFGEKILWKEGWEDILGEPEFKEQGIISNFAKVIKNFEETVGDLELNSHISVFIGRENPFPKAKEFTTIITRCRFPKNEEAVLAILGPKRMSYGKNINSLNALVKILEEL